MIQTILNLKARLEETGVAISSIRDMMSCFENIPLDKVSTSMTINSTASILLSLYIVLQNHKEFLQCRLGVQPRMIY